MVKLNWSATLHHIFKCSLFWSCISCASSEHCYSSWFILWISLFPNGWSSVISLIFINSSSFLRRSSSFGKSPTREVLFRWRVCRCLRYISTWTYWSWSWCLIFQSSCSSSSITKSKLWLLNEFRFIFRIILRAWSLFKSVQLHLQEHKFFNILTLGSVPILGAAHLGLLD